MTRTVRWVAVGVGAIGVSLLAQNPPARLRIVSPGDQAYVSGPVMLRALIDPPAAAGQVVRLAFFADGRQVCALDAPPFECAWDAGERVREHVIRAVALLGNGQRLVQNVRTKGLDYAETVDVDLVQVTAVVTDGGRFVHGLVKKDFRVFEDEVEQEITSFGPAGQVPLELIAAIDVSGSMSKAMPSVKAAARDFLNTLGPDDQVSLLAFNDNLFTLVRRSTDRAVRARAVDRLAPWGGTALYDVILKALDLVGRQQGRRAIVVFSDGHDESSFAHLDTVVRRVESSDSTMYMIGQGDALRNETFQGVLERLAHVSGGRAFATGDPGRLEKAFAEIIEDLSNQYLLAYPPKITKRDGAWRRIRVDVTGGRSQVRARQGYRTVKRQ
jgi:Ca-activated chloride channel family protein